MHINTLRMHCFAASLPQLHVIIGRCSLERWGPSTCHKRLCTVQPCLTRSDLNKASQVRHGTKVSMAKQHCLCTALIWILCISFQQQQQLLAGGGCVALVHTQTLPLSATLLLANQALTDLANIACLSPAETFRQSCAACHVAMQLCLCASGRADGSAAGKNIIQ